MTVFPSLQHTLRRLCLIATLATLFLWPPPATASLLHLEGPPPADLGLQAGRLAACPSPAHCSRAEWSVADPQQALARLLPAVLALDGVALVQTQADYLHATLTSRVFGFVDDLELHADNGRGLLEACSRSRLGDSDFGVNARRLRSLEAALAQTGA
ncbi:MAG: DUF1499 domain-containing protein [Synechococcaceae cyanobacterium]|nr:DUF1499 domain-containing protein [Synechococcaceae cyanobacterium]